MLDLGDSTMRRREVLATAAIRAAYAWTQRHEQDQAWRELARMTGVVMAACGPGRGPRSPHALVECLRQPLGRIAPDCFEGDPLGDLVVIVDVHGRDEIGPGVFDRGCERIVELIESPGATRTWMPTWAYMRAEQVQGNAFARLRDGATDEQYTRGRRFVVEHSAGPADRIAEAAASLGTRRTVPYVAVPADRVHVRGVRWPCPVCRWPMRVDGDDAGCDFEPHQARYFVRPSNSRRPTLARAFPQAPRPPAALPHQPDGPGASVCVEAAVWRHTVVPGLPEVELFERVNRRPGVVEARLWPDKDRVDGEAFVPLLDWHLEWDMKDSASAVALVDRLRRKPPATRNIVVPDYRGPVQQRELQDLVPDLRVWTATEVVAKVARVACKAAR